MPPSVVPRVRTIGRSADQYVRQDLTQRTKAFHERPFQPFQLEREYSRAVTAAKLTRMFAKPFLRAMGDHVEGVYALCGHPRSVTTFASASVDGTVKIHDISTGKLLSSLEAHQGWVTGLCMPAYGFSAPTFFDRPGEEGPARKGDLMITCARDSKVRLWRLPPVQVLGDRAVDVRSRQPALLDTVGLPCSPAAMAVPVYKASQATGAPSPRYAIAGAQGVLVYDLERHDPLWTMTFSALGSMDSGYDGVEYNPADQNLLCAVSETTCSLFDVRVGIPVLRFSLWARPNCVRFNPYVPTMLAVASNDSYTYTFDIRALGKSVKPGRESEYHASALDRYAGNLNAVLSCAFSPDGSCLATGGYDDTIRLYKVRTVGLGHRTLDNGAGTVLFEKVEWEGEGPPADAAGASPGDLAGNAGVQVEKDRAFAHAEVIRPYDTYHSSRMRGINCICYSGDGRFVVSGSEDANIRVWKANASESLKTMGRREQDAMNYRRTLVQKFQNAPEVRHILNSRKLPKRLQTAERARKRHLEAERRKEDRREANGGEARERALRGAVRDVQG